MADRDRVSAPQDGSGVEVVGRLADEIVPSLIARLEQSGLAEIEVRRNGWRVRLRRSVELERQTPAVGTRPAGRSGDRPAERGERGTDAASSRPHALRSERSRRQVTSPAVGYYQPREGLTVGSSVRQGDVIGHVEVLGVRQAVVAPEDGTVISIEAQAGEAVEYGQSVARLDSAVRVDGDGSA